ncbi:hypothetical protein HYFRA_00011288 [Hymenoscyphus fraxineus]|uniref:SHSP domain-containing protein n=1 Tax=Hymenoscyphus fraxineus TaxID=746836 RepID=A0A9N9KYC5_9HELO|nr:hypothetical protein HYFRA_00011288 [Hymenoscyphus fraxineus]
MAAPPVFSPRFDVKETPTMYELYGELPGMDGKNLDIEFSDATTLVIRGRVDRFYERQATFPNASLATAIALSHPAPKDPKKTEDDKKPVEVQKSPQEIAQETEAQIRTGGKYWVAERVVGDFVRSFGFPVQVDQDDVKASMGNGVLSIYVPKAGTRRGRRIPI